MTVDPARKASGPVKIEFFLPECNMNMTPGEPVGPSANRKKCKVFTGRGRWSIVNVLPQPIFEKEKRFANRIKDSAIVLASNAYVFRKTFALFRDSPPRE